MHCKAASGACLSTSAVSSVVVGLGFLGAGRQGNAPSLSARPRTTHHAPVASASIDLALAKQNLHCTIVRLKVASFFFILSFLFFSFPSVLFFSRRHFFFLLSEFRQSVLILLFGEKLSEMTPSSFVTQLVACRARRRIVMAMALAPIEPLLLECSWHGRKIMEAYVLGGTLRH